MLLPCFYISVFLSSGKEKHYPHYGNSSPLPKITNWTLLTKELFACMVFVHRGTILPSTAFFNFASNKTKTLSCIKWLAPFLIIISILFRFIAWNEYIIPNINSDRFWLEWYMKIYYPTYTRLDSGYWCAYRLFFKIHPYSEISFISTETDFSLVE